MSKAPVVSVCMITYNHEKFIAQAIESVLMQKTNFDFELVIGEDFSIDRTREICISYKRKYPEKINLILNEKNLGMIPNFINTIHQCKGEYIALLEGDDFWTDPYKLQKQVDFLESNTEFSACAHQSETIYDFKIEQKKQFYKNNINKTVLYTKDLLIKIPFHISSIVFNQERIDISTISDYKLFRDHPLFIILSTLGPIKVFPYVMSVYRKNKGGVSERTNPTLIYEANIKTANCLNIYLDNFYFKSLLMKSHWIKYYLLNNKLKLSEKIVLFVKFSFFSIYDFPKNIRTILATFYRAFL